MEKQLNFIIISNNIFHFFIKNHNLKNNINKSLNNQRKINHLNHLTNHKPQQKPKKLFFIKKHKLMP